MSILPRLGTTTSEHIRRSWAAMSHASYGEALYSESLGRRLGGGTKDWNSCGRLPVNSYRLGIVFLLLAISGCGGGGGFNPDKVTVSVSPANPMIATSATVELHASVQGLCSTCAAAINEWNVTENNDDPSCNWFDTPPTQPCPGGTIQKTAGGGPLTTLTATYHAPSSAGTFHVVAEWCLCFGSSVTKDGTSVITVSP
jgi:hypothetical protein